MTIAQHSIAAARKALSDGRSALIWARLIADTETPVSAALKLIEPERGDFVLESVEGGAVRGRYSLIGIAPDLVFRATGRSAEVNRNWRTDRTAFTPLESDPLTALRALVAECRADVDPALPPALACLVGYFAYETFGLVEKLPRPADNGLGTPDMLFVRPTVVLVFDRLADALYIVAPAWADRLSERSADALIEAAQGRIEDAAAQLARPLPAAIAQAPDIDLDEITPTAVMKPEDYAQMVLKAKDYIVAGDIFQVVLAQRFTTPFPLPAIDLYRALRRINPSPFLYHLDLPGFALTGSSPEILVRVRDGEVTIRPIAGTRPRGKTASEDAENRDSLLADPKERAEHLMLLDLGRNDVGRVASAGSVKVTDSYTVEFYSHVMHIVSNVVGRLDPKHDPIDALFAGFPAGTVSGAPKVRACQIIAELEPETRGPYAGGVGYFSPDGNMDSCIVLRTALVKDGVLHAQAGAGIVADSDPAYEQRECQHKAGALFAAAREAVKVAQDGRFGQ
ncbi:MAG: anthranilate synthase component I [Alphaproteobacteria bacterium]|nr:anthranilate synthase component I [Alphaproteobacteria bacterium]MBU0795287.1 anthranilate synthase component I [Alphaproteobacteria bacterium]MBU0875030.1 anthranilate synthase component I [Alphaproteobacteria bacterium]MBU1769180.1 anthranilate synthase component I [Alphaproteobacteria bacterium]